MATNTSPCVAFFSLGDFITELQSATYRDDSPIVRLESLTTTRGGNPSPTVRYEIWVTACPHRTILVARFFIGQELAIFRDQHAVHVNNQSRALEIVRAKLIACGCDVRPGVYQHDTDMQAHGDGLWQFNDDRELIAIEESSEQEETHF